jgi:tetratricopeptide (TPR) repeat protein
LETEANLRLAFSRYSLGDYAQVQNLTRRNIQLLTEDRIHATFIGPSLPSASRQWLVRCLAECGQFVEAIPWAEEALRIAEVTGRANSLVFALCFLGELHLQRGAVPEAASVLERAVQLCRVEEIVTIFPEAAAALGLAYALLGRFSEAMLLLEKSVEYAAKGYGDEPRRISLVGEGCLLAGHIDKATRLAEEALKLSRDRAERGHEAWALRLLGDIGTHRDPPEATAAETSYGQAIALAGELGMRPLVAHCHFGLGKLYRRQGEREQAREHLTTATTTYREMDMTYWLERAEAEMKACT